MALLDPFKAGWHITPQMAKSDDDQPILVMRGPGVGTY